MSVIDDVLRRRGNGLDSVVGARIYEEDGVELVAMVTPEEEAIQFLLDGIGVATLAEPALPPYGPDRRASAASIRL